jgi:hypothetical protein
MLEEVKQNGRLEVPTVLTPRMRRVKQKRRDYILKKERQEENQEL